MPEPEKEARPYVIVVEVDADPKRAFDAISDAAFALSQSAQVVGGYDCIERIEAAKKDEARLDVRRMIERYRGPGDHWRMTFARLIGPSSVPLGEGEDDDQAL